MRSDRPGLVLAPKPWIVPIPGTTKLHRLDENVGAAAVELTIDDLHKGADALSEIEVLGDRYPAHLQKLVSRQDCATHLLPPRASRREQNQPLEDEPQRVKVLNAIERR